MTLANHDIIRAFENQAALRLQHHQVSETFAKSKERLAEIDTALAFVDQITEIHNRIALHIEENVVWPVAKSSIWAKVLDENPSFKVVGWQGGEQTLVATTFAFDSAMEAAKDFVAARYSAL